MELARGVEGRVAWAAEYRVLELAHEFAERLRELDFRIEARNATEIAARLGGMPAIHIPEVRTDLSSARVLVMEWLEGVSVRQRERIDELGLDRRLLAEQFLRCCLQQMLVDGHFHADPHPGNVMVLRDGRIGLIDFGAAGRLDPMQQSSLRAMIVAVSRRDRPCCGRRCSKWRPSGGLRRRAARAGAGPVHGPAPGRGGRTELVALAPLLRRASPVTSTGWPPSPSAGPADAGEPVRRAGRRQGRDPMAQPGRARLPRRRRGADLRPPGRAGGPAVHRTTTLYQFFGYFGLFCSTVLVLRVLVAILHGGVN
jgi:hypothetical protein